MCERRYASAQGLEHLDLHGGVVDVILATHHVGHVQIDVVDRRGQHVEERSVFANDHRIAEVGARNANRAAHPVGPRHFVRIEPKTPVRLQAFVLQPGALGRAQAKERAVVNRRLAGGELAAALERQFGRGLEARI